MNIHPAPIHQFAAAAVGVVLLVAMLIVPLSSPSGRQIIADGLQSSLTTSTPEGSSGKNPPVKATTVPDSARRISTADGVKDILTRGLVGTTFDFQSIDAHTPDKSDRVPEGYSARTLILSIDGGCNGGYGPADFNGQGKLTAREFAATLMYCPGTTGRAEELLLSILVPGAELFRDGDKVWIGRNNRAVEFRLKA